MAKLYINPSRFEQRNTEVEEQIKHIRRFMQLVEQCKQYDTMHQQELKDISERLERMERNLTRLMAATEDMLKEFAKLEAEYKESLGYARHKVQMLFEQSI